MHNIQIPGNIRIKMIINSMIYFNVFFYAMERLKEI